MKDRKPKIHCLKTWCPLFAHMVSGEKTFDYRLNDRDFVVDDVLVLQEWDQNEKQYTGEVLAVWVEYVLYGGQFGIPDSYVIMGIRVQE